jgi:hypothetical protein
MPEDKTLPEKITGTSPILAIGLAVAVAAVMVTVTTIIFLNSSAYTTVKQIQTGSVVISSLDLDRDGIDTITPIKAADIDAYAKNIKQRLQSLDDSGDFGPAPVSDSSLGLQ